MLEGMDLEGNAQACGMSVATVRRRLARAERRFFRLAGQCEALAPWLAEHDRRGGGGGGDASADEESSK
jgi:RNA polymerase sigma-70 factor (ECF subfamily)